MDERQDAPRDGENDKNGARDYPIIAPPEQTGLTPEEEAYVPGVEARPMPKGIVIAVLAAIAAALAFSGFFYYRGSVLPEKLYREAAGFFDNGDYEKALAAYGEVLRLKPTRRDTLFKMGLCLEALSRSEDAATEYERHLSKEPTDTEALLRLGTLRFDAGQYGGALSNLEKFEKLSESSRVRPVSVDYMMAVIYDKSGNKSDAADRYVSAVRGGAGKPELIYAAGRALMRLGRYKEALDGFTAMERYAASGDKRALHSANAARAMLGWPDSPSRVIVPGKSMGFISIGDTEDDVTALCGKPAEYVSDGHYAVLGYDVEQGAPLTLVYLEDSAVIEATTRDAKYKTADGLGISNFTEPKYADRFDVWEARKGDKKVYRYILKGGGVAFYADGGGKIAVLYGGGAPLSQSGEYEWTKR
jgi:tetratricopeptide (TPR) repeat protein